MLLSVEVSDIGECVKTKVFVKVAPLGSDDVNVLDFVNTFNCVNELDFVDVFDSVNVFDAENVRDSVSAFDCANVLDCANVSVSGRHSSIVVPLDTFKFPNVSF